MEAREILTETPRATWPDELRKRGEFTCEPGVPGILRPAFLWIKPGELPAIYSQENNADALARVKLFTPDGSWSWYLVEWDGADEAFGLVDGFEAELGYIDLADLARSRGKLGLPIERDLYFAPKPWREILKELEARRG